MSGVGWKRGLAAVLFPERCACCGEVVRVGEDCCEHCRASLSHIAPPVCPFCGRGRDACRCRQHRRHFERCVSPFYYDGAIQKGILRLKEEERWETVRFLASKMAETVEREYADVSFDGIAPVPMTKRALKKRGFNQSLLLTRELGKRLSLPVTEPLQKLVDTRPQKVLSAAERSGNVLGVFDLTEGASPAGLTLLLVDDLVTTGATLDECAKMLKIYGAEAVYAVTASATRPEKSEKEEQEDAPA